MEAFEPRPLTAEETEAGIVVSVDTFDDLPAVDTTCWVASREAAVLVALSDSRLSRAAASPRYPISEAELRL